MLKTVGRLECLRRATGLKGPLKKPHKPGGSYVYMKDDWRECSPVSANVVGMSGRGVTSFEMIR
jgi:hypothetical protein